MVKYTLMVTAELKNSTNLQPEGGCNDASFLYLFKLKCGYYTELIEKGPGKEQWLKCGYCTELTEKETGVSLDFRIPKRNTHLVQRCKGCSRTGTVTMISGQGSPLTLAHSKAGKYAPLMVFDCRGYEPMDFVFGRGWKAQSLKGTTFGIDFYQGAFEARDEKGKRVRVSNPLAKFV